MAAANTDPGVIQLAAGTYRLSRPLVITRSGVVLRGEGVSAASTGLSPALGVQRLPAALLLYAACPAAELYDAQQRGPNTAA